MGKHVQITGIIHIIFSVLGILGGIILFVVLAGAGVIAQDEEAMKILSIIGTILGSFLLIVSLPGLIGGIGLLFKKRWARIVIIIVSILNLINIPIGTALGIYSLWVLFNDESVSLFDGNEQIEQS